MPTQITIRITHPQPKENATADPVDEIKNFMQIPVNLLKPSWDIKSDYSFTLNWDENDVAQTITNDE